MREKKEIDEIPKRYHSLNEACVLLSEKPHTLRSWAKLFPGIREKKKNSPFSFSQDELDIFKHVKFLLRDRKFKLEGALIEVDNSWHSMTHEKHKQLMYNSVDRGHKVKNTANNLENK